MNRRFNDLPSPPSEKMDILHSWIDDLARLMEDLNDLLADAIDLIEDIHEEVATQA